MNIWFPDIQFFFTVFLQLCLITESYYIFPSKRCTGETYSCRRMCSLPFKWVLFPSHCGEFQLPFEDMGNGSQWALKCATSDGTYPFSNSGSLLSKFSLNFVWCGSTMQDKYLNPFVMRDVIYTSIKCSVIMMIIMIYTLKLEIWFHGANKLSYINISTSEKSGHTFPFNWMRRCLQTFDWYCIHREAAWCLQNSKFSTWLH